MSEGGEARYAMRDRLVCIIPPLLVLSNTTIPVGSTKCEKTALSNSIRTGTVLS